MTSSSNTFSFGFRIVGSTANDRRLVDWSAAFAGYAECDERAEVTREAYLSAFRFGVAFKDHLIATGSSKGYSGPTWSNLLWFDIDHDDIDKATREARRLASGLADRFKIDGDHLLVFFSGSKGFHVGLPLSVCGDPGPSENFHKVCRRFAEDVSGGLSVSIDASVYDKVRAFRAPNSRHQKTGLHKRHLSFDELLSLSVRRIVEIASEPQPFELPDVPDVADQAVRDWSAASEAIASECQAAELRRQSVGITGANLNRSTLEFIRDGALTGGSSSDQELGKGRHRLLFSAAANLAEFGCSLALAEALLTESALDSGLSPSDVRRQIECGINHKPQG
jgi:hypothetical protein